MNTDEHESVDLLTERVLGAVLEVSNTLGAGFLEKVYERALLAELRIRGIGPPHRLRFQSPTRINVLENTSPILSSKTF